MDPRGASMTFEEAEVITNAEPAPEPPQLGEIKFEGEAVPEALRGKTAADLVSMVQKTQEALSISEKARLEAQQQAQATPAPPPPPEPQAQESQELTEEQLLELREDPVKYTDYQLKRAVELISQNMDQRLRGLSESTSVAAEQSARERFSLEFELFGDQIDQTVKNLPDRSAMSQSQGMGRSDGLHSGQARELPETSGSSLREGSYGGC